MKRLSTWWHQQNARTQQVAVWAGLLGLPLALVFLWWIPGQIAVRQAEQAHQEALALAQQLAQLGPLLQQQAPGTPPSPEQIPDRVRALLTAENLSSEPFVTGEEGLRVSLPTASMASVTRWLTACRRAGLVPHSLSVSGADESFRIDVVLRAVP